MRVYIYPIVGVLLIFGLYRRFRSGGRSPARALITRLGRTLGGHRLLGDTGLVAAREIHERLRGKFFRVITLVLLAVVAAAIVIPTIHSSRRTTVRIGLVGNLTSAQEVASLAALAHLHLTPRMVNEPDLSDGRSALLRHRVTLVIDHGRRILVETPIATGKSTSTASAATAIASVLGVENAFHAAGLTASQASAVAHAKPLSIQSIATRQNSAARGTSVIGLIFIFILLTQYLTWTLVGVMEEKSSRVVEVLLSAVRPVQLLGGKVLGIGLVALLQAGLVVAFALILGDAVGSDLLKGTAPAVLAASLVWLVLAYAFYSWVFAAAGSMAERQDQAQSLSLPLSVPIIFGYVYALVNAGPGPASLLMKVLAYLPPTAPFGMPLLVSKGEVTWWGFALAVVFSVASTFVVAHFAATFYRRAVLRTGHRLRFREVVAARH
jgi:ABC-2 type transport system permease protein